MDFYCYFRVKKSIMKPGFMWKKVEKRGIQMKDKMVWFLSKDELGKMQRFANKEDYTTFRFCGILVIVFQMVMFLFKPIEGRSSTHSDVVQ